MDPKFQSSFIPKAPVVANAAGVSVGKTTRSRSGGVISFVAYLIFIISLVLALGVYGYKFYLKYSIERMGTRLTEAQAVLEPEVIQKLVRLDGRIIATRDLVSKHSVLTPLFNFLEVSTPKTVRFNQFSYVVNSKGEPALSLKGEARGYAALALQSGIFNDSGYFKNATFSNLILNVKGDISFSFDGSLDSNLVSYKKIVESIRPSATIPSATTSVATTTTP